MKLFQSVRNVKSGRFGYVSHVSKNGICVSEISEMLVREVKKPGKYNIFPIENCEWECANVPNSLPIKPQP